jgi:hypothetical protein
VSHKPGVRFGVLAYGSRPELAGEAAAALLTIQAHAPAGSEIVLLTDRPEHYRWLGADLTIERLSADTIREWRGGYDDQFRPSLEALRRLATDGTADVVLADTDTMVRADLSPMADRLAAGAVFMHRREYALGAPPRKNDRHLAKEIVGRSWQGITPAATAGMWNAGVVASSRHHAGIFDRTLAVYDEIKPVTRYFAVDQLACSIVLAEYAPIEAAEPWFDHYWANRSWYDAAIARFLSDVLLEGLTASAAGERLKAHPIVGALDGRVPWWFRRLRKIVERGG